MNSLGYKCRRYVNKTALLACGIINTQTTQMYIAASKDDLKVNIDTLEKCTTAVHQWLLHNGLQAAAESQQVRGDSVHSC